MSIRSILKNKYFRLFFNLSLGILIWFFIIRAFLNTGATSLSLKIKRYDFFFLSLFFMFLIGVVHPWFVKIALKKATFFQCFRIWWLSTMGRYLPGKLWMFAGFVYFTKKEGFDHIKYSSVMVFIQIAVILSSLFLIIPMFGSKYIPFYYSLPIFFLLLIIYFSPSIYVPLLKKIIKREIYKPDFLDMFLILLLSMVVWFVYGNSLLFFVKSLGGDIGLLKSMGIFSLSYIGGLLSIFTPGGIGVREGIMTLMLKDNYSSFAFKVPIYIRAINIFSEIIFFLISYISLLRFKKMKKDTEKS